MVIIKQEVAAGVGGVEKKADSRQFLYYRFRWREIYEQIYFSRRAKKVKSNTLRFWPGLMRISSNWRELGPMQKTKYFELNKNLFVAFAL